VSPSSTDKIAGGLPPGTFKLARRGVAAELIFFYSYMYKNMYKFVTGRNFE